MQILKPRTLRTVLQIATWQIGVTESPSNSNKQKYGEAFGMNGYAWCLMFVWWVFHEAGFNLYKSASCTQFVNQYKSKSPAQVIRDNYEPGDIVFFDFTGKKSKTEHCGIVDTVAGEYIYTIEGNTSNGNDANGGTVMRRTRNLKFVTVGIRPKYTE